MTQIIKREPIHPDQDCVGDLPPLPSFNIRKLNKAIHDHGFSPKLESSIGERWKARKPHPDENPSSPVNER
jgi:hypothetical protein